ncbi:MAG TPA: DUF2062 domain-containing protein [Bacteroidia bacterium]|nr:DUF2062 domain-containing protein [Bacteroidia bacterium]
MKWIARKAAQLLELEDSPRSIAAGVAVGTFVGFVPLVGFKTLLAISGAKLVRGNLVASAIAVTLHDILIPLAPILLHWEYRLGYWMLNRPSHLPDLLPPTPHGLSAWMHWSTLQSVGLPLLLGSATVGLPVAVASGVLLHRLLSRRRVGESGDGEKIDGL